MNKVLIIIPTYNEKDNAEPISRAVLEVCPEANVLFVDDNSPDGTGELVDALCAEDPRIHVIHRPGKEGLGRAYINGFQWALENEYEFIFEMDADFSHDPKEIPAFLEAAREADLVLGTRYLGGVRVINWPLGRLFLSKGAGVYVRTITGMPFSDPTGGYKCFRRSVLTHIDLDNIRSNGYSFQIEMTHRAWTLGFRVAEVPITFEDRRAGFSKMNSSIFHEALWMVWKLWFRSGLKRSAPRKAHPESIAS